MHRTAAKSLDDERTISLCCCDSRTAESRNLLSLGHNNIVCCIVHSPTNPGFMACSDDFRARFCCSSEQFVPSELLQVLKRTPHERKEGEGLQEQGQAFCGSGALHQYSRYSYYQYRCKRYQLESSEEPAHITDMRGTSIREGAPKTLLARALYDNHPDCSDELAFSRGDILTIVEQNVPESEGWWKCLLHGRQGLAPANRLQVLKETPADRSCPLLLDTDLTSSEALYQVPSLFCPPPPGPVYEPMKSWVEGPLPATAQVYEFPDSPSSARIVCEKTLSFPKQTLFVLPRPVRASLPTLPSQVYDVPVQSQVSSTLKNPEKQPFYDIPTSSKKAALHCSTSQASGQSAVLMPTTAFRQGGGYNTLASPPKSEWMTGTPVMLGKADIRSVSLSSREAGSGAVPGSTSAAHNGAVALSPQLGSTVQKQSSLPEEPSYAVPAPRDSLPSDAGSSYRVPSRFLIPRVEQQNTKPNIYDSPKAMQGVSQAGKELEKIKEVPENTPWISRQLNALSPDSDQLSVASSDSRASMVSSCSSISTDSSPGSSSEDSAKELWMDMDFAKETAMALQHKVASSAAGLLLFVSRTWRFRDSLETNIHTIRRAADHIEEALREFLDFAQGVGRTAGSLTDSQLQARIRDQIQIISGSYQTLLDAKGSLDHCNWSLEVLVTDKVQNSLDDLERFVMVARMVPEDVKRFTSIVIANGRLLFKQNCEKGETELKCEKCMQPPQWETESYQRSSPFNKQPANQHCLELVKKNRVNVCGQSPSSLTTPPPNRQDTERKIHLSEHCRLYFGALFKAIGVFTSSLSNSQPPEVFITQSKLVITVGQKLVDTLCKETQEKDERNEILRGSSHLCGLLKDLALATKNAVIKYPSPSALSCLQTEVEKLEHHTRKFRDTLE
ncbi:cas scaffolding protein family member 4 [Onychomys torridus]|uniref:cas scaffolding protein family member 4 n=1 Tax=Onychomys torridus TaxID=38674 RepID=UPI00167F593C|nr:cas scaffolding protein family member 4 [Onychomys torridus]